MQQTLAQKLSKLATLADIVRVRWKTENLG